MKLARKLVCGEALSKFKESCRCLCHGKRLAFEKNNEDTISHALLALDSFGLVEVQRMELFTLRAKGDAGCDFRQLGSNEHIITHTFFTDENMFHATVSSSI